MIQPTVISHSQFELLLLDLQLSLQNAEAQYTSLAQSIDTKFINDYYEPIWQMINVYKRKIHRQYISAYQPPNFLNDKEKDLIQALFFDDIVKELAAHYRDSSV